jgi:hypothetical protein
MARHVKTSGIVLMAIIKRIANYHIGTCHKCPTKKNGVPYCQSFPRGKECQYTNACVEFTSTKQCSLCVAQRST